MREQIPQYGWYNLMFFQLFKEYLADSPNKSLSQFFDDFQTIHGFKSAGQEFEPMNPGVVLSSFYLLMALPREFWETDKIKGTSFNFNSRKNFKFLNTKHLRNSDWDFSKFSNLSTWDFIRLMRNSVSHGNLEVNINSQSYVLWNITSKNVKNFEVEFTHQDVGEFLTEIAKYYINDVKPKS